MELVYNFHFIKSTWGISISLKGEDIENEVFENAISITEQISLYINLTWNLLPNEISFLEQGIQKVADEVHKKLSENSRVVIKVNEINFSESDYQAEGLYCSIIGWLSKRYNFKIPDIKISFDKESNKYKIEGLN